MTLKECEKGERKEHRADGTIWHLRRENGVSLLVGTGFVLGNDEKIGGFQW